MKKKLFTIALSLLVCSSMLTQLTACGKKNAQEADDDSASAAQAEDVTAVETESESETLEDSILGMWTGSKFIVDGSVYTLAEIESTGDYSVSNEYLVIKEGGSAYFSENGKGSMLEWSLSEEEENVIIVGSGEMTYDPETQLLCIVSNSNYIYFEKISDSQDISTIPENKTVPEEESSESQASTDKAEETSSSGKQSSDNQSSDNQSSGNVSADFKEAMDEYEAFFDEYVEFMEEYTSASTNKQLSMLSDYTEMLTKYTEVFSDLYAVDSSKLSAADYAYYLEVMARIQEKLLEID